MASSALALLVLFAGVANAHYQIEFPAPRGPFVADEQVNFCSGYNNVGERTPFPLEDGYILMSTGHGPWTFGIVLSTSQNPTSFDDFAVDGEQQFVRYFAQETPAGDFCIPLSVNDAGVEGAFDGANVTFQFVYQASDGDLYQCSDVILSSNVTLDPSACTNTTNTHGHGSEGGDSQGDDHSEGDSSVVDSAALINSHCLVLLLMFAGIALSVL